MLKSFLIPIIIVAAMVLHTGMALAETGKGLPEYKLSISFDPGKNLLLGNASVILPAKNKTYFYTGDLSILSVDLDGRPAVYKKTADGFEISAEGRVDIRYQGVFKGEKNGGGHGNIGVVNRGIVSAEGISLTSGWYPSLAGLAHYDLTAIVPGNFTAVSEAEEITSEEDPAGRKYSFHFPHPLNGINFVAGHYTEIKDTVNGIAVYAYFFPEDISLAERYIENTKRYIGMYSQMLVPYPYKRFSVVENIQPTGYSMPTFTLLGRDVVRLPFIPETSLGHEITHQWFGNYVYWSGGRGNWLEAITTYLSDEYYQEQQEKGWEYRKKILTDYQSYVNSKNDFPLKDFTERRDPASMAIGYGKGAMVFHMLRKSLGDGIFYTSLRTLIRENEFREASWADIQNAFAKESGRDLGWFFAQWLERKGVPDLSIKDEREMVLDGIPSASFEVLQNEDVYRIGLPLRITDEKGAVQKLLETGKKDEHFKIDTETKPRKITLDPEYDIMRRLSPGEYPPVISRLLGDEKKVIIYTEKEKKRYTALIDSLEAENFKVVSDSGIKDEEIRTSSLLVLGFESPVLKRLFGKVEKPQAGFMLVVRQNPINPSKVVAYAEGDSEEEVSLAARKIVHYGNYSVLRFEKGKNVLKETAVSDRGMPFTLSEPVKGLRTANTQDLGSIIEYVADSPAIFIGERHTNYEDHKVELDVVMALFRKGKKIAIGMEMFQRPFQKAIDEYIAGSIDEKELLKRTEYFKRWRFDYNLYREIIEYARAKRIPIVALNLKAEIVEKVAAGGLDALTETERKEIPQDLDMSDEAYRERLNQIYQMHPKGPKFDNFYQSQVLWDETMAHTAAEYMKTNSEYQLVVMAGGEHVMYSSGIPQRFKRISGKNYSTIINGTYDENIGTYVLFPNEITPPFTAKLGTVLNERDGGLSIESFSPGSAAEKAGLKKGDIIISIAGVPAKTSEDARIALYDKTPGQTVQVEVLRKRFLLGTQKMEFGITF